MKFITPDAMREAEGRAILKNPSLACRMMDYAGKGLADAIASIAKRADLTDPVIRLLAGPGNNGGDAFAAAICLQEMDLLPEVWLTCPLDQLKGAAKTYFEEMDALDIPWEEVDTDEAWDHFSVESLPPPILVDALLGTGAKGELTGSIRRGCEYLRAHRAHCLIVSADIPTGMNGETGALAEGAVQADVTVTMGLPKVGMATSGALESLGSLWRVEIGLPEEAEKAIPDARPDLQWVSGKEARGALPDRRRLTHKGVYGRALVMGGSWQYPGAIVLAAEGAARSGVGLVRVATVERALPAVVSRVPEAIAAADLDAEFPLDGMKAILLGPGLGRTPEARRLVARLLHETPCPLVLDADGISVLEGKPEAIQACEQPVILTPHPGELSLLIGKPIAEIQADRLSAVREAAKRTGAIVVLKGAGTLVAKEGRSTCLNLNGNPGMACGGSGDVLAGLLVGLLAQGMEPFAAAQASVWIHGAAGDVAALRMTQPSMKAGDIADALPEAFRQLTIR